MSDEATTEQPATEAATDAATKETRSMRRRRRLPTSSPADLAKRLRSGIAPHRASLASLAARAGVPAPVVAAVKAAKGWNDDTVLTAAELRQAAADWLDAPANQGGE